MTWLLRCLGTSETEATVGHGTRVTCGSVVLGQRTGSRPEPASGSAPAGRHVAAPCRPAARRETGTLAAAAAVPVS